MSNFVRHIPCLKCGSRDNRGLWDDGHEFCFGCKDMSPGEQRKYTKSQIKSMKVQLDWQLPSDFNSVLSDPGLSWLEKYDVDPFIACKYGFGWSSSRLLLLCPLYMGRRYIGYQGRTFGGGPKYITKINPEFKDKYFYRLDGELFPNIVVLVEDIVSAIKVHLAGYTSIALMGSFLKPQIRDHILTLNKDTYILPWLDPDKYQESVKICNEMELYGYPSEYIWTSGQDPKDHTVEKIKQIIDLRLSWIDTKSRDSNVTRNLGEEFV